MFALFKKKVVETVVKLEPAAINLEGIAASLARDNKYARRLEVLKDAVQARILKFGEDSRVSEYRAEIAVIEKLLAGKI